MIKKSRWTPLPAQDRYGRPEEVNRDPDENQISFSGNELCPKCELRPLNRNGKCPHCDID